jgi:hypothetical protein
MDDNDNNNDGYTPSDNVQRQIEKLKKADQQQQKRTLSYYAELKKKDPKIYLDPKIALQMEKDSQALGPAFFDGDE